VHESKARTLATNAFAAQRCLDLRGGCKRHARERKYSSGVGGMPPTVMCLGLAVHRVRSVSVTANRRALVNLSVVSIKQMNLTRCVWFNVYEITPFNYGVAI
jgi:hypothetical protein